MARAAALRAAGYTVYTVGIGPIAAKGSTDGVSVTNLLAYTGNCANRVWQQNDFASSPATLAPLVIQAINYPQPCVVPG